MSTLELVGASDRSTKAKVKSLLGFSSTHRSITFFLIHQVLFYLAQAYSILGQNVGTDYPLEWNAKVKVRRESLANAMMNNGKLRSRRS